MQEIADVKLNQYHPLRQRKFVHDKEKKTLNTVFQNSSFSLPWETNRQLSRKISSKTIRFSIFNNSSQSEFFSFTVVLN